MINLDLPTLNTINNSTMRRPDEPVMSHINKIILPKKKFIIGNDKYIETAEDESDQSNEENLSMSKTVQKYQDLINSD